MNRITILCDWKVAQTRKGGRKRRWKRIEANLRQSSEAVIKVKQIYLFARSSIQQNP